MLKAVKTDLSDLCDAIEHLKALVPKMTEQEKIDVGARLRPLIKNAEAIDEMVKEMVKAKLKGKPGSVPGETFKATMTIAATTRLSSTRVKDDFPEVYAECSVTSQQQTIRYEAR